MRDGAAHKSAEDVEAFDRGVETLFRGDLIDVDENSDFGARRSSCAPAAAAGTAAAAAG